MKRLALAILFALTLQGFSETPEATFEAARTAYDAGQYQQAAGLYDELLAERWLSPEVYFNRGNALARLGKSGEAIANYEMALLLNPRDADAAANLQFLREQAGLTAPEQSLLARLAVHYTTAEWRTAALALWWIFATLLATYWLLESRPYWLRQCTILAIALLFLAAAGFAHSWWQQRNPLVVVTKGQVHALFAPLSDATPFFDTPEGSTLRLVEQTGDWLRVRSGKQIGWIPSQDCAILGL